MDLDRPLALASRATLFLAARIGRRPRLAVLFAFTLPYLAFAWGVGRSYPLNRMRMFAPPTTVASHLVARTSDGRLREVAFFTRWSCAGALELGREGSGAPLGGDEIVRSRILRHAGEPTHPIPVELIRRTSRIPLAHGPIVQHDEVLVGCQADLLEAPQW